MYVPDLVPTTSSVVFQELPAGISPKEQVRDEFDLVHPAAVPSIMVAAVSAARIGPLICSSTYQVRLPYC